MAVILDHAAGTGAAGSAAAGSAAVESVARILTILRAGAEHARTHSFDMNRLSRWGGRLEGGGHGPIDRPIGQRVRFRSRRWFIVPIAAAAVRGGPPPPALAGPSSDRMNASSNPQQRAIERNYQFAMDCGR